VQPDAIGSARVTWRVVVSRRRLPQTVFEESNTFLWRARELEEPLAARLKTSLGDAWTCAPDFVTDEELSRIYSGHPEWEEQYEETWRSVVEYLTDRMRRTGASWIVPDSVASTTDPIFGQHEKSEYVAVGITPYYVVREPDPTALQQAWRDGGSAAGELGLLTLADVPTGTGTFDDLSRIAGRVTDLVVEAYDHPGLVIVLSADRDTFASP
jgi:hypothetical protein